MSVGQGQPLNSFGKARGSATAEPLSPYDFERVGFREQARSATAPFFLRDRAYLHLTLQSFQSGDLPAANTYLGEWSKLLDTAPQTSPEVKGRREFLKGLQLLAAEDYPAAFRQLRSAPNSFALKDIQSNFSAYWQRIHGRALIQFLRASTPHNQQQDAYFDRFVAGFERSGSLKGAFGALDAAEQNWLRSRWSEEALGELFTVASTDNPDGFMEELLGVAAHWRGRGDREQANALLSLIDNDGAKDVFSYAVPKDVRANAAALKAGGRYGKGGNPWGRDLESSLASMSFSDFSRGVQKGGAWIGIATLACAYFRPLRPWAARGIYALSEPAAAALLLGTGGYTLYEGAPHAGEALRRLVGPGSSSFDDFLTVTGYSLGALAVGLGTTSFVLGGNHGYRFGSAVRSQGGRPLEAWEAGYMQGDAARRAIQDPEIWVNYARSATGLSARTRAWLEFGGKAVDATLVKGSILYGAGRFAYGLQQMNATDGRSTAGFGDLLLRFGLDVFPATTIHLYRAGRGDRRFQVGPAMSQEINDAVYANPTYRQRVLQRLADGMPSLTINRHDTLITRARREFSQMEAILKEAENLVPLTPVKPSVFYAGASAARPVTTAPVAFSPESHQPADFASLHARFARADLAGQRSIYQRGEFSPRGVWRAILAHPVIREGAIFPRSLSEGPLGKALEAMVEESTRRWEAGLARPLEGIFFAAKDIFPGADGVMMAGTKTGRFAGNESNPVIRDLMNLGAIPLPVGMVAAANGGWGGDAGFGYIPHPTRAGHDPAGSSSGAAHVVGRKDFLVNWGIGTDTGGSVTAPAGAVGLTGFVPPKGVFSTQNMIPFMTQLDRVALLSNSTEDAMQIAKLLGRPVPSDPNMRVASPGQEFQASPFAPRIVYLEELVQSAQLSPFARKIFLDRMAKLRGEGWEVLPLGKEWNFLSEFPYLVYPWDAYTAAAFTHTNPMQVNRFEPPRRTLDNNLLTRMPFGAFSLKEGHFDHARELSRRYQDLVREKLGPGVLVASPSTEAIPTALIREGKAGDNLDFHDMITMMKNRVEEFGQISLPLSENLQAGIAITGRLPDLLHFMDRPKMRAVPVTISPNEHALEVSPERPINVPERGNKVVPISSARARAGRSRPASPAEL